MERPIFNGGNFYDDPLSYNAYVKKLNEYCDYLERQIDIWEESV